MKSIGMFSGYCEELREIIDKMSDEEYAKEAKDNAEILNFIGYKRKGEKNDKETNRV